MRVILCFVIWLSGCAGHGVHCDGRLTPINRPAVGAGSGGPASSSASERPHD